MRRQNKNPKSRMSAAPWAHIQQLAEKIFMLDRRFILPHQRSLLCESPYQQYTPLAAKVNDE